MRIQRSSKQAPNLDAGLRTLFQAVTPERLADWVKHVAIPRHFHAHVENNRAVRDWLVRFFVDLGYHVKLQGRWDNVVALPANPCDDGMLLVGAHYDSVPDSPGADDNGSAVAVMMGTAFALAQSQPHLPVCFVAFNREEDGLIGSADFVAADQNDELLLDEVHILEMVGYRDDAPGSQKMPFPLPMPDTGDFIGLLSNRESNDLVTELVAQAGSLVPGLNVLALKVYLGLEKHLPHLGRSDHAPFWKERIPAVMWTDTADFRNPHYHQPSDLPDTLDYEFMAQTNRLLLARIFQKLHHRFN